MTYGLDKEPERQIKAIDCEEVRSKLEPGLYKVIARVYF